LVACGSGSGASTEHGGGARCGGQPLSCDEVMSRYLDDQREAPLIAMELEADCMGERDDACLTWAYFLVDGADVDRNPRRAAEIFDGACGRGDNRACMRLGKIYFEGTTGANDDRAASVLTRACEGEEAEACFLLGELHRTGRGVDRNERAAARYHRLACERGFTRGCRRAADHYAGEEDRNSLVSLYDGMCSNDEAQGCLMLADLYRRGTDVGELRQAGRLLERACDRGDVNGCGAYGRALAHGDLGVVPHAGRARELLERACEAENWPACAELGRLNDEGVGARRDRGRAEEYYERACDRRSGLACFELGLLHRDTYGRGDLERSVELFRRACQSGEYERACGSLAAAYDVGRGVEIDRSEALALYHRACDAGHPDSCIRLADLIASGDASNGEDASFYRDRACALAPAEDRCTPAPGAPMSLRAQVTERVGRVGPAAGTTCAIGVERRMPPHWCSIRVMCGGRSFYSGWAKCEGHGDSLVATDWETTPFDGTPALDVDTAHGRGHVADVGTNSEPRGFVLEL
jgi:TPR repeat protein